MALFVNAAFLAALFFAPKLLLTFLNPDSRSGHDPRASFPAYPDKQLAISLLDEISQTRPSAYMPFVGWRRKSHHDLSNVNIIGPYFNRKSLGGDLKRSSWFFGGSTMWGEGAADGETIPSQYHLLTGKRVFNFGEIGWTSSQSLNQLIIALSDGHRPSEVIFYSGVNDVLQQCRSEVGTIPSHAYHSRIDKALQNSVKAMIFDRVQSNLIEPYLKLISILTNNSVDVRQGSYNCDTNQKKARQIARHLVAKWKKAFVIAQYHDANFLAVLQPTVFTSNDDHNYFNSSELHTYHLLINQYSTIYPLVVSELKRVCKEDAQFCNSVIDGKSWLLDQDNIFIDFCHINGRGNKVVAQNIVQILHE